MILTPHRLFFILLLAAQGLVAQVNADRLPGRIPPQYGTPFSGVPDPPDAIIYQVNIRAFSPTHDFRGVIDRLDQIRALGVNVIYLMPVYPVGVLKSFNSPYCIKDFLSVGPEFGTLTDLRNLVDGAHSRGMAVMLDWVVNQTSWDHPWIRQHPDWYLHDAEGNIKILGGYTDVAALDFANPAMRDTLINDMRSWVYTANIDGFRCDFADNPPVDFWQQAIDTLRKISTHKLLLLAEGTRSANYAAGFDYNFGMQFYYNSLKPIFTGSASGLSVSGPSTSAPPVATTPAGPTTSATAAPPSAPAANAAAPTHIASVSATIDNSNTVEYTGSTGDRQIVRYLTNHDVDGSDGAPVTMFGGKRGSMAAFVVIAYMKGIPFIYNGQEVAFPAPITFPFNSVTIDWTINPEITEEYKRIIAFRNSNPVVRRGLLTSYSTNDICAFTKTSGTDQVLVLSNLRDNIVNYTLPTGLANTKWIDVFNHRPVSLGVSLSLKPYQYMVLSAGN